MLVPKNARERGVNFTCNKDFDVEKYDHFLLVKNYLSEITN